MEKETNSNDGWLRSIAKLSEKVPALFASGFACGILALMILFELRRADGLWLIPLYYLLPISMLAWFGGMRLALLATIISFSLPGIYSLSVNASVSGTWAAWLARLATFSIGILLARALSTARLMLDFVDQGATWRAAQDPMPIGERLLIVPHLDLEEPVDRVPSDPERDVPIFIQPGMAFGSSSHPTTRMCLELMEKNVPVDFKVLDVGCGTGILSIAAAKLGAAEVQAVDIDLKSIKVAQTNLDRNQVADKVTVRHGSLEVIGQNQNHVNSGSEEQGGGRTPPSPASQFDLILANLLTDVIQELLAAGLPDLLASDGRLILSGIREDEVMGIKRALQEHNLRLKEQLIQDGWCALAAIR